MKPVKKFALPFAAGVLGIYSSLAAQATTAKSQRPNILFILTDDMGYYDLGCYGNPFNETPAIDSLARSGIRFTQAYACSPVSSPSRAGLLTGKYPSRLQLTNFLGGERTDSLSPLLPAKWKPYLEAREKTMAEYLQELGYTTGIVGKWHLGGHDSIAPWGQGFDFTRMIGRNGLDYYNYSIYEDSYQQEFVDAGKNYLTDQLTSYGIEFIRENKDQPFFLYLSYSAPHVFTVPRGDKLKKYFQKYNSFDGKYNPEYAAMVESIDDGVRLLLNELKTSGLLENTLIVFTSDNGGVGLPELGPTPTNMEPLRKWKGHLYEGGIRVPAIVAWKGHLPGGYVCDSYFSNIDYLPSFAELLGIPANPGWDGKSILRLFQHPEDTRFDRGDIFWHYPHFSNQGGRPAGAVREGDYKLVELFETNSFELYNLEEDIGETKDVLTIYPEKAAALKISLQKWQIATGANMPVKK